MSRLQRNPWLGETKPREDRELLPELLEDLPVALGLLERHLAGAVGRIEAFPKSHHDTVPAELRVVAHALLSIPPLLGKQGKVFDLHCQAVKITFNGLRYSRRRSHRTISRSGC